MNKVILCGNLGKDPEIRQVGSGDTVATFSLATVEKWKDRNGQRQEKTEWHQVIAWRRPAEIVGRYLTQGSKVLIEGKLQTRSWNDNKTGEKRSRTEIFLERLEMLGGGNRQDGGQGRSDGGHSAHGSNHHSGQELDNPREDGDIPF